MLHLPNSKKKKKELKFSDDKFSLNCIILFVVFYIFFFLVPVLTCPLLKYALESFIIIWV